MINDLGVGVKCCSTCTRRLPLDQFSNNRRARDGLQNVCNECKRAYQQRWYSRASKSPAFVDKMNTVQRQRALKKQLKRYELSEADYDELTACGCGICGGPPRGRGRYHFDHDHETGAFRGLLCTHCNTALGLFDDDIDRLLEAVHYLNRSREGKER